MYPTDPLRGTSGSPIVPGAYDFERNYDYDRPPPGSPTHPTATTLPNDIGNSNGELPTSPLGTTMPHPSFLRRAVGAILPTHYVRIPTDETHAGSQNDGVFSNVFAKTTSSAQVQVEDGSIYMMPEETQSTAPPSYAAAQADAVPPYWDTIVHAPAGMDTDVGMIIGDLPSGSILVFGSNFLASFFFQFIGFLLTYLLHTTHAAKYGSRAGLGLTLLQYGFFSRFAKVDTPSPDGNGTTDDPMLSTPPTSSAPMPEDDNIVLNISSREWLSFLLMTLGWFLLLSSSISFWRLKNWESSIRASTSRQSHSQEEIARDVATRRNIEQAFHIAPVEEHERTSLGSPFFALPASRESTETDSRAAYTL
ncbi:hypothetical protein M405DRAFT_748137 [Rhizopogon salebrosus TDB-379]|nr:hypothetical protein M405DRAFT_748137 [Rhizopogon salebrosus TDB-379]